MKKKAFEFSAQFAWPLFLVLGIQSCTKPEFVAPEPVATVAMHDGKPELVVHDHDRLKKVVEVAFPANTEIDTVFVHNMDSSNGNSDVYLTAIGLVDLDGKQDVPVSANLRVMYSTGTVHQADNHLTYCTPRWGCPGCYGSFNRCWCTSAPVSDDPRYINTACMPSHSIPTVQLDPATIVAFINKNVSME